VPIAAPVAIAASSQSPRMWSGRVREITYFKIDQVTDGKFPLDNESFEYLKTCLAVSPIEIELSQGQDANKNKPL
jgi:hypothetical protein